MRRLFVTGLSVFLISAGSIAVDRARTLRDGAGRTVLVSRQPARIVSLAPSVTEILFALEAGDRVVGVTDFCDYPAEVASRSRIGGLINPDLERIISLQPDLVIATTAGNYQDDAERIQRVGIPVYTISTPTLEAMLDTLGQVGDLVGKPEAARRLAARLRGRIEAVKQAMARQPRARALFVIEPDPLIAPGRDTFIGQALAIAGADLTTTDAASSWTHYDAEQVMGMRPEIILTTGANRAWALALPDRPEWAGVPAVRAGRVFVISDAIQHPGPRLVDGIEEISRIVREAMASGGVKPAR